MGDLTAPLLQPPRPLQTADDCAEFSCGQIALDSWLKHRAQASEGRSARTYVVVAGARVAGYYCLSTSAVALGGLPKKLRRNMPTTAPVLLLGRLAIDADFQGRGLGRALLKDAILRCLGVADQVGIRALLVHAIDAEARDFYLKRGFIAYPETGDVLFLPVETMRLAAL